MNIDHLFSDVEVASSFFKRARGLIGSEEPVAGFALVFPRCSSVHCCFMRYPIDVIFLDGQGYVLDAKTVKPWQFATKKDCETIVECRAGTVKSLQILPGSRLVTSKQSEVLL